MSRDAGAVSGIWSAVLAGLLVFLGVVAFLPTPVDQPLQGVLAEFLRLVHAHGVPAWIDYRFVEAAANVALFVPFGFTAALAFPGKRWWQIAGLGLLTSGFMELGQLLFLHSRFPSALDLAANTSGCLAGCVLAAVFTRLRHAS